MNRGARSQVRDDLAKAKILLADVDGAIASLRAGMDDTRAAYAGSRRDADLALTLERIGQIEQNRGRLDAASAAFADNTALAQALFDAEPTNADRRASLARAIDQQGSVFEARHDLANATRIYRNEVALLEPLGGSTRPDLRFAYALACVNLANVLPPQEARTLLDKALAVAQVLVGAGQLHASQLDIIKKMERRSAALP